MREGPSSEVLAGAAGWAPVAASWLDGRLLAESIPIASGMLKATRSQQVPEELTFTVPDMADGFSWVPDAADHPLARNGQLIDLAIDVTSTTRDVTRTKLGRFRVHAWEYDDVARQVTVACQGVLSRVAGDAFTVPEVPKVAGTLASEFRRLMTPGIAVLIDPTLTDRACPQSFQWADDRLDALYGIADAWPARLLADQWGQVQVLAPLPDVPTPVLWFTDGEGGTVVAAPTSDTREGLANVVVATSSATDSAGLDPVSAIARVTAGPLAALDDGTGYGRVVRKFSSPLITTRAQALAAATEIVADSARAAVVRKVAVAPDPRVELDDPVSVTRHGVPQVGWVVAYELPLTVGDGPMRIDVGVAA